MSSNAALNWTRWQAPDMRQASPSPAPERPLAVATPPSHPELQVLRDEARREGWEQGLAEGRQAARGELKLQAERWQQLAAHLARPLAALDEQVEEELMDLVMTLSRRVVMAELRARPEQILAVIREAVKALPSASRHVRIHLHPEDAHLIAEQLPSHGEVQWHVIEDLAISRGGCLLDSGSSHVDARLETRLDEAMMALAGGDGLPAQVAG